MKKWILFLLLLPNLAWGATYTVCASGCDQTTIQAVFDGVDLALDDIVEVRAAAPGGTATFRESVLWGSNDSGTSGHPVILRGRSGDMINVSGSDLITTWTQVGATNVYQAACNWTAGVLVEDGTLRTFKTWNTNIATTNLSVGEWTLDTTGDLVYVWASDGLDPDTHTMEIGVRGIVIDTNDQSYLTISNLTLRDGNVKGGSSAVLYAGGSSVVGIVVDGCTVERGRGAGIWAYAATTATSINITNSIIRYNGYIGVLLDAVTSFSTGGNISGNSIYQNGKRVAQDVDQAAGIQGCLGNFNVFNNTIYDNCEAVHASKEGMSHGIYNPGGKAATMTAYQNTIYGHQHGSGIKCGSPSTIYQSNIYDNSAFGIESGNNSANTVFLFWGNVIHDNTLSGISQEAQVGTTSLTIENNTLYNNGDPSGQELVVNNDLSVLTVKNNILYATTGRRTFRLVAAQTGTVDIDNNLHWDVTPDLYYAGAEHTWAEWRGHGFDDTAGLNSDPLFVGAAGGDFHILPTSPCKDAGVSIAGLTHDYSGKMIPAGAAVDIGAYEATGGIVGLQTGAGSVGLGGSGTAALQ